MSVSNGHSRYQKWRTLIFCVTQTVTISPPLLRAEYRDWMSECNIIYEALGLRVSMVMMLDMTRLVMILSFSKPDNTNPPRFYIHLFVNTEKNFYDALHDGIWFVYEYYDSSAHPIKPRYVSHKRLEVPWDGYLLSFPSTKLLRHEFNAKIQVQVECNSFNSWLVPAQNDNECTECIIIIWMYL